MSNKNKGPIIKQAVINSGLSVSKVAKACEISRPTLYNIFLQRNPAEHYILKIGQAIGHDFSIEFPELAPKIRIETNVDYKVAYYELLEKYTKELEKNIAAAPSAPKVRQRKKR